MEVIPVINCENRADAEGKIATLRGFLEPGHFMHIDIADGVFAFHKTWNDPVAWREMIGGTFKLEAHLMVEHPWIWIAPWLAAGVARFIVHVEAIDDASFEIIKKWCDEHGTELMLASNPETPADHFSPYLSRCSMFQVLCVNPGLAGQAFLPLTLEKVKLIRQNAPHAIIEVDGGINPETARLAKDAGADIVVSATDIFSNNNPKEEYELLKKI
jgi:ribulose-phosphate 3-epimerase